MSVTPVSTTADVATERPARYGKQLVSHLSRRSPGVWDEASETGQIQFDGGTAALTAVDGALRLSLDTTTELVDRLEDVMGRHLVRFASKDTLDVQWTRSDGSTGTHQSSLDPSSGHDGPRGRESA